MSKKADVFNIHIAGNVLLELDKSHTHRYEDVVIIVRKKSSMNISNMPKDNVSSKIYENKAERIFF